MSRDELAVRVIVYILLIAGSAIVMLPFAWMLSTSLKVKSQIMVFPPIWIPDPIVGRHYVDVFAEFPFALYLRNTLIICVFTVFGIMLSSSLVAYGFARLRWPDRRWLFIVLLSTMMLPAQVTMVPVFLLFRSFGWIDTFLPLIVPAFFGSPFFIFLLRQFFLSIPHEMVEAARIDGASELRIFSRVMLPLSKPALATVGIFSFMGAWNDFMGPLIYLNSESRKTLALGIQALRSFHDTEWGLLMAASVLMTVPIIILFFFCQRFFIEGITLTGMKA